MPVESHFDPRKFVNREFEQELFRTLLQFKDDARILAIKDKGGMGKTTLLQMLAYRCRSSKPCIPVSLVPLDQLLDNDPLTLIKAIAQDLVAFGLDFPTFDRLNVARISGDFTPFFSSAARGISSTLPSDAVVKGVAVEAVAVGRVVISSASGGVLTPEQQAIAHEVCLQAFFQDLKRHCAETPVVFMFDSYERCASDLNRWIMTYLLERYFFDQASRPARLVLVLAGREIPDFEFYWSAEDIDAIVRVVNSLRQWSKRDVEDLLRAHGVAYKPEDVAFLYNTIERGLSLPLVLEVYAQLLDDKSDAAHKGRSVDIISSVISRLQLVGRDQELIQFNKILEEEQPALVVVTGEAGMGKTTLLRAFQLLSVVQGWETAPGSGSSELHIEASTSEATFCSRVREVLCILTNEPLSEVNPDIDGSGKLQHGIGQPQDPLLQASNRAIAAMLHGTAGLKQASSMGADESVPSSSLHPLVEQLCRRGPVVLFIDGYRPTHSFSSWFEQRFIPDLKRSGTPIVIVVAEQPGEIHTLISLAKVHLSIGKLDSQSSAQLLDEISRQIVPPIEGRELNVYVEEIRERPGMLDSLKRILQLARPVDQ